MLHRTFAAGAAIAACLAAMPAAAQQTLPQAQKDTIRKEVTAAVDQYYRFFSAHEMKALPETSFNIPWVMIGAEGPDADVTKEQALARFQASLKQLVASGWGKSVFTTEQVCVLNPSAAIASGYNTRYKTDGSVMSVSGVTYVFGRTPQGWKIVSYTSMPRGVTVRCD